MNAATADFRKRRAEDLLRRARQQLGDETAIREELAELSTETADDRRRRRELLELVTPDGRRRQVAPVSVTDAGHLFCELPPDDPRDRQPFEHFAGPHEVERADVTWWTNRAEALRVKVERVKQCGTAKLETTCHECGVVKDTVIRCGDFRLCLHCRNARMLEYQARFQRSHEQTHREVREAGLHKNFARHGYAWRPRFITLTLPHASIGADLAELPKAWPKFMQRIKQHLERDRFHVHDRASEDHDAATCSKCASARDLAKRLRFVRVLEVTPGGDGTEADDELRAAKGHAHMHVYMYGPYIERDALALWWAQSLSDSYRANLPTVDRFELLDGIEDPKRRRRVGELLRTRRGPHGRPLFEVPRPVVDVRACKGSPKDIAAELAKYLVKDGERDKATGELQHVDPVWFAAVYEALTKRRSIAASRYFWVIIVRDPPSVCCKDCGGFHVVTVFVDEGAPRGPPMAPKKAQTRVSTGTCAVA